MELRGTTDAVQEVRRTSERSVLWATLAGAGLRVWAYHFPYRRHGKLCEVVLVSEKGCVGPKRKDDVLWMWYTVNWIDKGGSVRW